MKALRTAWEHSQQGLLLFERGRTKYLNPSAARMLEADPTRVVGKPLMLALRNHRLETLCQSTGQAQIEVRGRVLQAEALPGILYLTDQTAQQQRREALESSSRLLAHEFRTPVTGMLSLLEAVRQGLPSAEQKEALELMYQEVQRLARLVEDLPLHRPPQRQRTFPLQELRPRLERFLAPLLDSSDSWIRWELSHTVHADPDAVYQVLLNLLENALRYGPGGEVWVLSEVRAKALHLEVHDRGQALPEYQPLFETGQRGLHAAHVRGSGLGLALVRRMAEDWGGGAYGKHQDGRNVFGVHFPLKSDNQPRSEYARQL